MTGIAKAKIDSPEVNYAKLRVSLELFQKPLIELTSGEYQQMLQQVNRELAIAGRVLAAKEAGEVMIPESVVKQAADELASRFESDEDFERVLRDNHLDRDSLLEALAHDLRVEAILEKVLAQKGAVSDEEAEIYYYQHLERFELPETRTARHILITFNEDYPENSRAQVEQRMSEIKSQIQSDSENFKELAQRHSECPTSMHEGLLGRIKSGQLYPELDQCLFRMEEGEISELLESPMGIHILLCETIHPAERLSFDQVRDKLRDHLESKKRKQLLQDWLQQKA